MNNEKIVLNALQQVVDTCASSSCKDEEGSTVFFMKMIEKFLSSCKLASDSLGTKEERSYFDSQISTFILYMVRVVSEHWTEEEKKTVLSTLFFLEEANCFSI